jgi:ubiquinone/menaquinone biosynthesis C-methylase UbiE
MSHLDAAKLDRPERAVEQRTDLLMQLLPVTPGSGYTIADIGAGSGYLTLRLSRQYPDARILAVDIQPEMLEIVAQRAAIEGLTNIELVRATSDRTGLAPGSADLILLIDSYHEFLWPRETMLDLISALTDGGQIVVIEERLAGANKGLVATHRMSAEQLIREMNAVGLTVYAMSDLLPRQHFISFAKTD